METESESGRRHGAVRFLKRNLVAEIALVLAVLTAFAVPPDRAYLSYFEPRTLVCLFVTLAVVSALERIHFFSMLARRIIRVFRTTRSATIALVYITFLGSMFMANDMALITFLPLGYFVLHETDKKKLLPFAFIMQNIAANLGGMLTPFGNPQNLYLYSYFSIPAGAFMQTMLAPFLTAVILMTLVCLFVPVEFFHIGSEEDKQMQPRRTILYLALFLLSVLMVLRLIPYPVVLVVVVIALLIVDRGVFLKVDYGLLCTFAFFFVFSGNLSRIEVVSRVLSGWLASLPLEVSVLSCQVISNVPSAILLSQFTENWRPLLIGVNIGGTGTLIASLASLITFRTYLSVRPGDARRYLLYFAGLNVLFLGTLYICCKFFFL